MNFLRRVCNHGKELLPSKALMVYGAANKESALEQSMLRSLGTPSCSLCGTDLEGVKHSPEHGGTCAACASPEAPDTTDTSPGPSRISQQRDAASSSLAGSNDLRATSDFPRPSAKIRCLLGNILAEQRQKMAKSLSKCM